MMPTTDYEPKLARAEKRIEESDEISDSNRELLWDFKRDLELRNYSKGRIYKLISYIKLIAEHADFDLEDATEENIKDVVAWLNRRDVSEVTKNDTRTILKMFYKWLNGGSYPDSVEWIKTTRKKKNSTLPKDVLTEEDVQRLIESAANPRDRALISLLWESGARIGELIDLEIGDLEDHPHGMKVVINGKTGPRRIPLISSVPHLQFWVNTHPKSGEKDSPLWVNVGTRNKGEKMKYRAIRKTLTEIFKRAGVDKPSNPHHFRHSRATFLASKFTESQLCEWFGWVQGSDRPATYVHMSGRDIDADYARLHGIEDEDNPKESKLTPRSCSRCGVKNDPNASFCQKCGQALSHEAFQKLEREEGFSDEVAEKIDEMGATGSLGELIDRAVEERVKEEMEKVRKEMSREEGPT